MNTIQERIAALCGDRPSTLSIEFNPHWVLYQDAADYVRENHSDFCDEEDRQLCIANNSIWCASWYAATPVGHYAVCASSLDKALDAMLRIKAEQ